MIAVAYSASWWPIVGLIVALTVWFACALCTAAKTPTPLAPIARGGTLRTRPPTVGRDAAQAVAPTPAGAVSLRAVGGVTKPARAGSVSRRETPAPLARQPHGSTHKGAA